MGYLLHSIVTQQSFPRNTSQNVFNIIKNGEQTYKALKWLVDKLMKLSAKITMQKKQLLTYQLKTSRSSKEN